MNPRQAKAVEIASRFRIEEKQGKWIVPSQTNNSGVYSVGLNGTPRCTCPDFDTRGVVCKHIMAVQITMEERYGDGTKTVEESVSVTETVKRTYSRTGPPTTTPRSTKKTSSRSCSRTSLTAFPSPPGRKQEESLSQYRTPSLQPPSKSTARFPAEGS